MTATPIRQRARGFSLVELMVALTTGLLVAAVIATMFASNARTFAVTSGVGELQEAGRNAFDVLQRDVRMAGYQGCDSSGHGAATRMASLVTKRDGEADNPALTITAQTEVIGDSLALWVPVGESMVLANAMGDAAEALQVNTPRGVAVSDRLLIADCAAAAVFRVTSMGKGLIEHNQSLNDSAALPRAFGTDALLLRVERHRYFVAPSSRSGAGQRSLWRQVDARAPAEVAGDVQDLRLQFGLDTDADGVPNRFVPTSDMKAADWPRVTAVQLNLLLRGAVAGRSAANTSYVFNGQTVTPSDRRMYRVYSATLPLRNRQS
jgi:type IV pilus assembly protein PilW